jgi:dTDP-4-dehydrorhamnose 3,5-epimerase
VGQALDVVVDIRKDSPTYGQHCTILLDAEQQNMVWVPEGFAHGFAALTDVVFFYKCTNTYAPDQEGGLLWNDPVLNIDWQVENPQVSAKDAVLPAFQEMVSYF